MRRREVLLAPVDLELLSLLSRETTLVDACRSVGITHDRGTYRLRRLARALGRPVTRSVRGGDRHGTTRLTDAGRRLVEGPPGTAVGPGTSTARSSRPWLEGRYRAGPSPTVALPGGPTLAVAFRADDEETVRFAWPPESVLVATGRFRTSARNVLPGTVVGVRRRGPGTGAAQRHLDVRVGARVLPVAITESAIQALRLTAGRRVYLYVKATALRRADRPRRRPTRGSLPR